MITIVLTYLADQVTYYALQLTRSSVENFIIVF